MGISLKKAQQLTNVIYLWVIVTILFEILWMNRIKQCIDVHSITLKKFVSPAMVHFNQN